MKHFIKRMLFCFLYLLIFRGPVPVYAQIMGYPLPGNTEYADRDGRLIDRFVCENDKSFNSIVCDTDTGTAYLSSTNMDLPYIVRMDLSTLEKTGTLILDNGLSAVQTAEKNPLASEIWYGTNGFVVVLDSELFQIKTLIDLGDQTCKQLLFNPDNGMMTAILTGETDAIATIDPADYSVDRFLFTGYSGTFSTGVLSSGGNVLYILTSSIPSQVLAVDMAIHEIVQTADVPGSFRATAMAENPVTPELYVAVPGTPAIVYRLSLPQLAITGSLLLPADERPRNFMWCDPAGNYTYINDSDASSGLIRINTYLFQRDTRLDFEDLHYPVCVDRYQDSVIIATENAPGAVIEIQPDEFRVVRHALFNDLASSAGPIGCALAPEQMFVAVDNGGSRRLIGFNVLTGNQCRVIDLPDVAGALTHVAGSADENIGYWMETGNESHVLSIDYELGQVLNRQLLPEQITCKGVFFDPESARLYILSSTTIYDLNAETLQIDDTVLLPTELAPPAGFTFDPLHNRLLIGGKSGSRKIWQYQTQPLTLFGTIDLDSNELQAVFLETDARKQDAIIGIKSSPFRLRRFDLATQAFSEPAFFPFNGHNLLYCSYLAHQNQVMLIESGSPMVLHRFDSDGFEWLSSIDLGPGDSVSGIGQAHTEPYAFMGMSGSCATLTRYGVTQAHAIHGSWAVLGSPAQMESLHFYSHEPGNELRLAIYSSQFERLWESDSIDNDVEGSWKSVFIHEGDPGFLELEPGDYLLAFQVTGDGASPSSTIVQAAKGIRVPWRYGAFPSHLVEVEETNVLWSLYADCMLANPTPTPQDTVTPVPSMTPTATPPTSTPVPTATPEATPSMTPTPRPGSGVELSLSQTHFFPGDTFVLSARMSNVEPSPINAHLYVILDVYGNYWFGPSWNQSVDAYAMTNLLGVRERTIFDFVWPDADSEADGLRFWAGLIQEGTNQLFGYYDMTEFGYGFSADTPSPTTSPTETQLPATGTPLPSATPTEPVCEIRIEFIEDDPMSYTGENCQLPDIFCFAPERVNFCSEPYPVVRVTNLGQISAGVEVILDGAEAGNFSLENGYLVIQPGETHVVHVQFCPRMPPDTLKEAQLIVTWHEGEERILLKGWSVAG